MSLTVIGSAQPIYTVGESHCMAFGNTLFQWPSGEVYLCRSRFIPELKAKDYTDENNKLHPLLMEALSAERLVDDRGLPRFLNENVSFAYYSGVPVMPPPIIFFAGDIDLHQVLFKEWDKDYDFAIPDDDIYGFDKSKKPVPLTAVCKKVESFFLPFARGILQLRDAGFSRLMIHCLPPRSKNPVKSRWLDFDLTLRAKITIVANSYLAQFCQRENIGYIDSWPETTENGYLRDELDIDGVHLVKSATLISLNKAMEHLYSHTALTYNPGRYKIALERSAPLLTRKRNTAVEEWNSLGVISGDLEESAVIPLSEGLVFDAPKNALERLDWVESSGARQGITVATPSLKHLETAAQLLENGKADILLHTGAKGKLTLSSFRPVCVKESVAFSKSPAPPGVRKAVLHLKGNGTIRFASANGDIIKEIEARQGTLTVYDPNRVACSYVPGNEDFYAVEITAIPQIPKQPFRVIWAGLKDYPVDPFSHSISGMLAFPPLVGERFLERAIPQPHDK